MLFSQACCLVKTSVAKTQLGLQFLEGYLKLYRKGFSKTASSSSCTVVLERTQEQGTGQGMSLGNSPSYLRKFNRTAHIASHVRSPHTYSADLGIRVLNFYIVTGCIHIMLMWGWGRSIANPAPEWTSGKNLNRMHFEACLKVYSFWFLT